MPLWLEAPREGLSPYWRIRGKHLGVGVNRSTKLRDRALAQKALAKARRGIERGALTDQADQPVTFAAAALAYMQNGGECRPMQRIIIKLGETPIADIDQIALDAAAAELLPHAPPTTRNREFYSPVIAVLHHAGVNTPFRRPKGWRGRRSTSWLSPEQAFALFAAADTIDAEFGLFCRFLLYTGLRLSEALRVQIGELELRRSFLYVPDTKTDEPRAVFLPQALVDALEAQPPRPARRGGRSQTDAAVPFLARGAAARLFRFHPSGHLRDLLTQSMQTAGLAFPRRQRGFHLFRHTYGTWMHRYGGLDTFGLTRTGTWADPRSADRYKHTETTEESRRADLLPTPAVRANGA